ncbi:MAG TPA: septal ring lytic transglycosylase RlpA [Oceanospirillaceae bacterium]|nr:septal ring lytic transglycosylase RlpA [Oceanospirillaceae bacterium]
MAGLISACSTTTSLNSSGITPSGNKKSAGTRYSIKHDHGPAQHEDMSGLADAVPRVEAHSRGGNKSTYEVWGKKYNVMPSSTGFTQTGLASWYGKKFHGHLTSNGETYDMYAMSAAHKNLPLPTFARITNLENGKIVIVRVNDRGPFHGDRVIDLSYAAASKLGYRKKGVAKVLIEAIDARSWSAAGEQALRRQRQSGETQVALQPVVQPHVKPVPQPVVLPQAKPVGSSMLTRQVARLPGFYIQVAALSKVDSAVGLGAKLKAQLQRMDVLVEKGNNGDIYRVIIGPIADRNSALLLGQKVVDYGFTNPLLLLP